MAKSTTARKSDLETSSGVNTEAKRGVKTNEISVTMTFKKETPGTFVFQDENEETLIPSLYIKKAAFGGGKPPPTITVTVK